MEGLIKYEMKSKIGGGRFEGWREEEGGERGGVSGEASGLAFGLGVSGIFEAGGAQGLILLRELLPLKPEKCFFLSWGLDEGPTVSNFPLTINSLGSCAFSGAG